MTDADSVIFQEACSLFKELWNGEPIRLLGIRTSKLAEEEEPQQLTIFDIQPIMREKVTQNKNQEKQKKLSAALDEIKKRYGEDSIVRGSQLDTKKTSGL